MQTIVRILVVAAIAALPNLASSQDVTATLLDGSSIAGQLREWRGENLIIVRADEEMRLQTEKLVSLRWSSPTPSAASDEMYGGLVELTDGTTLPIKEFQTHETTVIVEIDVPPPTNKTTMTLPLKQVVAVRLERFDPAIEEQWEEIRSQNFASDILVSIKRKSKSLDYHEGVLGDITPKKIGFEYDGETMRADRANVAGWVYFRKQPASEREPRCILHGHTGLRAAAADVRLSDQSLEIETAAGVKLTWPLADVYLADFSAGKIVYLSDLKPVFERWTPLVGLAVAAESAAKYGQVRLDQSAFGGPLELHINGSSASGSDVKSFSKGLAIRSRTELVYRLPPGFKQFVAIAGIEPVTRATGDVQLLIHGDDRSLLTADVDGGQAPREIKLDIAGVKRLKIIVDFGQNLDTGDWLNLCEARLIK
ncbi:MAG TPA: NPCBM/NEW2 domain-containing protein [Lacipirellulaceae bacterium]